MHYSLKEKYKKELVDIIRTKESLDGLPKGTILVGGDNAVFYTFEYLCWKVASYKLAVPQYIHNYLILNGPSSPLDEYFRTKTWVKAYLDLVEINNGQS